MLFGFCGSSSFHAAVSTIRAELRILMTGSENAPPRATAGGFAAERAIQSVTFAASFCLPCQPKSFVDGRATHSAKLPTMS